jgi:cobalt-precorrin-7 (C5)-methyltransferase
MTKIMVAGVGPGGEDYVLPVVKQKAAEADLLVGGERALALFRHLGKETLVVTADLPALAARLKEELAEKKIAVLVSGDSGFYSLLTFLRRHFSPQELEVYPGISSVQAAFARLGETWHDVTLLSVHGRDGSELLPALSAPGRKAVLTDRNWTPGRLAALIMAAGCGDRRVSLFYRLTCPDEKTVHTRLSALDAAAEGDCVMVIHHD